MADTLVVPHVIAPGTDHRRAYRYARVGWLSQYPLRTQIDYARQLDLLYEWCESNGSHPFELRRAELQLYITRPIVTRLATTSQLHYIAILRSFYKYCVDEEILERNPASKLRRPLYNDDDVHRPVLTRAQGEKFLAAAERTRPWLRLRDHAIAAVLLLNGLRVSSLVSMNLETMAVFRGHYVVNVYAKGTKYATIPLAPVTYFAVMSYVQDRTVGPVFLGREGERITQKVVQRRVEAIGRLAGLPHVTPHVLRRSFITEALNAGVPLADVQHAALHSDPKTTMLYDRRRQSLSRNPTYLLGGWFTAT